MWSWVRRLWVGEVPLARAFWDFGIIGGTALNALITFLAMAALAMDVPGALAVGLFLLPTPYNLLVVVAVWRSAAAYEGRRLWADFARIAIVFWAAAATAL